MIRTHLANDFELNALPDDRIAVPNRSLTSRNPRFSSFNFTSSDSSETSLIIRIKEALEFVFPQPNPLWGFSTNNTLSDNWLVATPYQVWGKPYTDFKMAERGIAGEAGIDPDFLLKIYAGDPGTGVAVPLDSTIKKINTPPTTLIEGHSYQIYERMYDVMTSAEQFLDFTTLTPPTGRFLAAFRNALSYISSKPPEARPIIRILYSSPSLALDPYPAAFLRDLINTIDGFETSPMEIYVMRLRSSSSSWNHAKIVAADGIRALVGGHNVWGDQYLDKNPVFDVSMEISGSGALHAQDYANKLWDYALSKAWCPLPKSMESLPIIPIVCSYASYRYNPESKKNEIKIGDLPSTNLYQDFRSRCQQSSEQAISVISAGRSADTDFNKTFPMLYSYFYPNKEPSNEAFIKMMQMATKRIWFSLQAFRLTGSTLSQDIFDLPPTQDTFIAWNNPLFLELGKAVQRQVEVKVVLSNPNALAGGLGPLQAPYNGENPAIIYEKLLLTMTGRLDIPDDVARAKIQQFVRVGSFRYYSEEDSYPPSDANPPTNDKTPIPNHAKTVMIDDQLFYIGSQNQYLCNLNEFGYFVEDSDIALKYREDYWDPLFANSNWMLPAYDLNLDLQEKVESVDFLASLNRNTRLRESWEKLLEERPQVENDNDQRAITDQMLDDVITNAGFLTTSDCILKVLESPFYQTGQNYDANAASDKFVASLANDRQLLWDFAEIVTREGNSYQDEIDAINQFITEKGYSCNLFQVQSSFEKLQQWIIEHWQGKYETWLYTDSGDAFFPPTASDLISLLAKDNNDTRLDNPSSTAQGYQGPLVSFSSLDDLSIDGITLINAAYKDGTLSWSSEKNSTSGELTFGEVTRPGLNDAFTGREFFGNIVYPDGANFPKSGIVSIYGRHSEDVSSSDPKGGDPFWWKIMTAIIGAGITGLLISKCIQKNCRNRRDHARREYNQVRRMDPGTSSDSGPSLVVNEIEMVNMSSDHRNNSDRIEYSRSSLRRRIVAENSSELIEEYKSELDTISGNLNWDIVENSIPEMIATHTTEVFEQTNRAEEGSLRRLEMQITSGLLKDLCEKVKAFVNENTKDELNPITDPYVKETLLDLAIIQPQFDHYKGTLSNQITSYVTQKYGEYLAKNPDQIRGEIGSQIAQAINSAKLVDWQPIEKNIQSDVSGIANDALESFDNPSDIFQMDAEHLADMLNTDKFKDIIQQKLSDYVNEALASNQQGVMQELLKLDLFSQISLTEQTFLGQNVRFGEIVAHFKCFEMAMQVNDQPSYINDALESAVLNKKCDFLNQPDLKTGIAKQIADSATLKTKEFARTSEEIDSTQQELKRISVLQDKNPDDIQLRDKRESLEREMEDLAKKESEFQEEIRQYESANRELNQDYCKEREAKAKGDMVEKGRDIFEV